MRGKFLLSGGGTLGVRHRELGPYRLELSQHGIGQGDLAAQVVDQVAHHDVHLPIQDCQEIDIQGARQVRETMPEARFVFLAPPTWEDLVRRLATRGTEGEAEREAREVAHA